jgi:hypothetical protein
MELKAILKELKNIHAHAVLTQHWAGELIKKIEGEKKPRKSRGLSIEDKARIDARIARTMYKPR